MCPRRPHGKINDLTLFLATETTNCKSRSQKVFFISRVKRRERNPLKRRVPPNLFSQQVNDRLYNLNTPGTKTSDTVSQTDNGGKKGRKNLHKKKKK